MSTTQATQDSIYKMLSDSTSTDNVSVLNTSRPLFSSSSSIIELDAIYSQLREKFIALFNSAKGEDFEDPLETEFASEFTYLLVKFGTLATAIVAEMVLGKQIEISIAAQALEIVGLFEHPSYYQDRKRLLELCLLKSDSAWVRDGAIRGISYMDDPHSLNLIELALNRENVTEIKDYILQVIEQLKDTQVEQAK